MTMFEDAPSTDGAEAGTKKFTVVLMTIYSVENAGIRYVSAALQRAGFHGIKERRTHIPALVRVITAIKPNVIFY